ncbi:MAG: HIT domain-containing protein [Nanoarchaeota archaeon]
MNKSEKECVFCKIIHGSIKAEKIAETNNFIAFLDAKPRTAGHTLIVPKKHYVTILDIPNKLSSELIELTKKIATNLLEKKLGDGFNILMNNLEPAGQVIKHAHIHVIPRKEGDKILITP